MTETTNLDPLRGYADPVPGREQRDTGKLIFAIPQPTVMAE